MLVVNLIMIQHPTESTWLNYFMPLTIKVYQCTLLPPEVRNFTHSICDFYLCLFVEEDINRVLHGKDWVLAYPVSHGGWEAVVAAGMAPRVSAAAGGRCWRQTPGAPVAARWAAPGRPPGAHAPLLEIRPRSCPIQSSGIVSSLYQDGRPPGNF